MDLLPWVHTCPPREGSLGVLLNSLAASDLGQYEIRVCEAKGLPRVEDWFLEQLDELTQKAPWVLRFEDDIVVSPHIRHNVENWPATRCPHFGIGLLFRFVWYKDNWVDWRIDAHHASLYTVNANVAGAQAVLYRSEVWPRIRAHLPRTYGSLMDLGVTQSVSMAGLRTYVHRPSLAQTTHVSKEHCLHHQNQHEHLATDYDPHYIRPLGESRDSSVLAWTAGAVTRYLPTNDGNALPVLVHPNKRGVDFADSLHRRVVVDHDKLVDDAEEALRRAKG